MIGRTWCRVGWAVLLGSCTPLGLWIYEDPVVTVSRVTLELKKARAQGISPVVVALAVDSRNDFARSSGSAP